MTARATVTIPSPGPVVCAGRHQFTHADDAGWRQCFNCHIREWNLSDVRPPEPIFRAADPFAIAQLRHLYAQMIGGHVTDCAEAARGILGPAIERLEATS